MATEARTERVAEFAFGDDDKEKLLHQAIQQMIVLRDVMRLVGKQLRYESLLPEKERLGEGQIRVLHALCEDGTMTVGSLAELCHVADPTISKILRSLEHGGWVSRQTDPNNRRVVWVGVTPAGQQVYERIKAHFEAGLASVLSPLTEEQLQDLIVAFGHLESLVGRDDRER